MQQVAVRWQSKIFRAVVVTVQLQLAQSMRAYECIISILLYIVSHGTLTIPAERCLLIFYLLYLYAQHTPAVKISHILAFDRSLYFFISVPNKPSSVFTKPKISLSIVLRKEISGSQFSLFMVILRRFISNKKSMFKRKVIFHFTIFLTKYIFFTVVVLCFFVFLCDNPSHLKFFRTKISSKRIFKYMLKSII